MDIEKKSGSLEYFKICALICKLDDEFNFSKEDLNKLKTYFKSSKLNVNKDKDLWKAVYEISEMFALSGSGVEKAIRKANDIPKEELQDYNFYLAQKIINKK